MAFKHRNHKQLKPVEFIVFLKYLARQKSEYILLQKPEYEQYILVLEQIFLEYKLVYTLQNAK